MLYGKLTEIKFIKSSEVRLRIDLITEPTITCWILSLVTEKLLLRNRSVDSDSKSKKYSN